MTRRSTAAARVRPGAVALALIALAFIALAVISAGGCAKEPPPGLGVSVPSTSTEPAAQGMAASSTPASKTVASGQRAPFEAYYYHRHRDGDRAIYRVIGNVHATNRMRVDYQYRMMKTVDGQITRVLGVRRDFGDGKALARFYLEDEASGTTREIGYARQGNLEITYFDPPPITLVWGSATSKGATLAIPYQPVRVQLGQRIPLGTATVDVMTVLGERTIKIKDATGTPVAYPVALVWRTTSADGSTLTQWFGRNGEIVLEEYANGTAHERRELIRVMRK